MRLHTIVLSCPGLIRAIGFISCWILTAWAYADHAPHPLVLDPASSGSRELLAPAMDYWIAPGPVDPEEIISGRHDGEFSTYDNRSIGPFGAELWFRFTLHVRGNKASQWVLNLENALLFDVGLFYKNRDGRLASSRAGMKHLASAQLISRHYFALPIEQAPGTRTYYLRVNTPFFIYFSPSINDMPAYLQHSSVDASLAFLFVGLLGGIFIYLVVLFLTIKVGGYTVECASFAFMSIMMVLYMNGFMTPWMGNLVWLKKHMWLFVHVALEISYLVVTQRYFRTQEKYPLIHRYSNICIALALLSILMLAIIPLESIVILQLVFIAHLIIVLTALSIYVRIIEGPSVSLFVIGNVGVLMAATLASLEAALNFQAGEWITKHGPALGFTWQATFFTAALSQHIGRIQEEKNRLAAESKAKSDFIAKMSHEIRTPMNGVIGMAQLLRTTKIDDEQKHYLNVIENSGKTLLAVINDILDYSRLAAGKVDLTPGSFNLEELLAEINTLFGDLAHEKGLSFTTILMPGTPTHLSGDSTRLRQILTNLLSNAFKFTERGAVILKISSLADDPVDSLPVANEHAVVQFSIKDTGIGIADEKQKMLFLNFGQIDNSLSRRYGGTGLGLSISKQLVELMGGRIDLTSSLGTGSEFTFTVKLNRLYTPIHRPATTTAPSSPNKQRILVAEDNEINRNVLAGYLQKMELDADFVCNGEEAVTALTSAQHCPYHLVLMDTEMPVLDGVQATIRIRQHEKLQLEKPVVILALSAHHSSSHRQACMNAGMNDCLEKPISYQQLQSMINQWSRSF